jgi:hypothetical protein
VAAEQHAMLSDARNAPQVHSRLREMAEVDPQFKGFGTDRHRCRLGPTLPVGETRPVRAQPRDHAARLYRMYQPSRPRHLR